MGLGGTGAGVTTTAKTVTAFSSRPLQTKLRAAMRAGTLRHAWRLSDGREVLLTERLCHVHDGRRVYSAPYPSSADVGMAVQAVMAVERGRDPFASGASGEEKKR